MNVIPTRRQLLDEINEKLENLSPNEVDKIFRRVSTTDMITLTIALDKFKEDILQKIT